MCNFFVMFQLYGVPLQVFLARPRALEGDGHSFPVVAWRYLLKPLSLIQVTVLLAKESDDEYLRCDSEKLLLHAEVLPTS
jgi:hypothetical protein